MLHAAAPATPPGCLTAAACAAAAPAERAAPAAAASQLPARRVLTVTAASAAAPPRPSEPPCAAAAASAAASATSPLLARPMLTVTRSRSAPPCRPARRSTAPVQVLVAPSPRRPAAVAVAGGFRTPAHPLVASGRFLPAAAAQAPTEVAAAAAPTSWSPAAPATPLTARAGGICRRSSAPVGDQEAAAPATPLTDRAGGVCRRLSAPAAPRRVAQGPPPQALGLALAPPPSGPAPAQPGAACLPDAQRLVEEARAKLAQAAAPAARLMSSTSVHEAARLPCPSLEQLCPPAGGVAAGVSGEGQVASPVPAAAARVDEILDAFSALQRHSAQQQAEQRAAVDGVAAQWEQRFGYVIECLMATTNAATIMNQRMAKFLRLGGVLEGVVSQLDADTTALGGRVSSLEADTRRLADDLAALRAGAAPGPHGELPSASAPAGVGLERIEASLQAVSAEVERLSWELCQESAERSQLACELQHHVAATADWRVSLESSDRGVVAEQVSRVHARVACVEQDNAACRARLDEEFARIRCLLQE
ncbi:unnamed protein product, partial [Prorocentrum cordatum]